VTVEVTQLATQEPQILVVAVADLAIKGLAYFLLVAQVDLE
jgi:hypothetical protein